MERNALLVWWLAEARARHLGDRDSPGLVFLAAMVAKGLMVASVGIARSCLSSVPTSGRKITLRSERTAG